MPGIVPDIGAVAAGLAEPEAVGVRGGADLEDEDQLVLRAIEAAHAAIGLVPDAEVLQLGERGLAGIEQFAHVAPVHADEGDRAVLGTRPRH